MKVLITSFHLGNSLEQLSKIANIDINDQPTVLSANELSLRMKDCDAVISLLDDEISKELMQSMPNLKMIANVAVGYDNIDIEAATQLGILVTNTPGVLSETTADLAFGLLIAAARRIAEGDNFIRQGKWTGFSPDLLLGVDIYGKTLGIIGFGRIGQAVAQRALGFNMKVIYAKRDSKKNHVTLKHVTLKAEALTMDEVLAKSDFISINCPLNKETYHLIGEREFSLMKPECILVNTARGAIIDQQALVRAIQNGKIKAAALDVFEDEPSVPNELIQSNRVVLTPHIGSASIETRAKMANLAISSAVSALQNKLPENAVNPDVLPLFQKRLQTLNKDK